MAEGTQQGYLIIADISGYTAYLTGTELAHAQDILTKLIQTIIDSYKPPIELVELEGDAVYVQLPGADARGQFVLDAIEGAYFAFARQRDTIAEIAPCVCAACANVPLLDLKFVVHFGEFGLQRLAGRLKPVGPNVILAHRLLKNHIAEVMGLHAYIFFTDAALTQLGLDAEAGGMTRHSEEYEHLGTVSGAVLNLIPRWEQERALRRVRIEPAAARCEHAVEVPAPPAVVWAYLTRPVLRARWESGQAAAVGAGAGEHTSRDHGETDASRTVLDWRPYDYFTISRALSGLLAPPVTQTVELAPKADGTRVSWYSSPGAGLRASLGFSLARGKLLASQRAGGERLRAVLAAEGAPPESGDAAASA